MTRNCTERSACRFQENQRFANAVLRWRLVSFYLGQTVLDPGHKTLQPQKSQPNFQQSSSPKLPPPSLFLCNSLSNKSFLGIYQQKRLSLTYKEHRNKICHALHKGMHSEMPPALTNTLSCDSEHQMLQQQGQSCRSDAHTNHQRFKGGAHLKRSPVSELSSWRSISWSHTGWK